MTIDHKTDIRTYNIPGIGKLEDTNSSHSFGLLQNILYNTIKNTVTFQFSNNNTKIIENISVNVESIII